MAKDQIGEAAGAFLTGLIFIPIGAVLYHITQNIATGLILALLPAFFALIELSHANHLSEEGLLTVPGWILGMVVAVYIFPQYWPFGLLSIVLATAVLLAKIEEWI